MASKDSDDFPFLDYLDELIEELHQNVPRALRDFDVEAIHQARVATRRLKAAIDLVGPCLTDDHRKSLNKRLKNLRRRLGPLRDLDVMIGHLEELAGKPAHAQAATWLRDHLARLRELKREESRKEAAPADILSKLGAWWPVRQEILDAREAIDSLLAESLHLQLDAFAERAMQVASMPTSQSEVSKDRQDPHELRIAGKLLRYTLELAQHQGHKLPGSVLRNFKRMQERLGTWHDYVVLVERVMRVSLDESVSYHNLALQESLLSLARMCLARAQKELAGFSKLWRERGDEVARTIRERFPLTRPISEPQTDPGPIDSGNIPAPAAPPPDVASTA